MAFIMGSAIIWNQYNTYMHDSKNLDTHGNLVVAMYTKVLGQLMWDLNYNDIGVMLSALQKDEVFRYAILHDSDNKILAEYGTKETAKNDISYLAPIEYLDDGQKHSLGNFKLVLTRNKLIENIQADILNNLGEMFLILMATLFAIYAVITIFIARPMRQMTMMMNQMAEGDLDRSVSYTRKDEFGLMATTFNTLTKKLRQNYQTLENRSAELEGANKDLETARSMAEAADKTKSQFLANMTHELRTPLNAIIGYSEMMVEDADELTTEDFVGDLQRVISSAKHLLALINDILDISKIESGKSTLDLEGFELKELVFDLESIVGPLIRKGNNGFEINFDETLVEVYSDQMKIRQCLLNLLSNAGKFTHNGKVTLEVNREKTNAEDWMIFKIIDTGIGMTEKQLKQIFNPFTQADQTTTRKYGGTGLGLAITEKIARLLGGNITVESTLGEGTRFIMRLPLKSENNPVLSSANQV